MRSISSAIHVFAQILFQLGEKFLASLAILGALLRPGIDPIEIVTPDEQVAREAAAVVQRIARGLGKLERFALAFGHLRGVDHGGRRRLFGFCAGFLSDLFFRCFERRFHIDHLSFRAKSRHLAEELLGSATRRSTRSTCEQFLLIKFVPSRACFFKISHGVNFSSVRASRSSSSTSLLQSKVFRKSQGPAAKRRETGSQNHSVIRVLRRIHDFLFYATSGLVHHQKDEAVSQLLSFTVAAGRDAAGWDFGRLQLPAGFAAVQSARHCASALVRRLRLCLRICKNPRPFCGRASADRAAKAEQLGRDRAGRTPSRACCRYRR